jgi:DNA-binding response OmpR family regulator
MTVSQPNATKARRALVAEDDPILADVVGFILEEAGFAVETVTNGSDAQRQLQSANYDLAILDVNMPGANGLDVVSQTRAGSRNATIPMVVMTGQHDSATTLKAYKSGATSFVSKPIDWQEFSRTVELIVRGAEKEAEDAATMEIVSTWLERAAKV